MTPTIEGGWRPAGSERLFSGCRRRSKSAVRKRATSSQGSQGFPNPHVRTAAATLAQFSARNFAGALLSASMMWTQERLPALNADFFGDEEVRGRFRRLDHRLPATHNRGLAKFSHNGW